MINLVAFLKENHNKKITVQTWFYAGIYRFCIRFVAMKKLQKYFGVEGEESAEDVKPEDYKFARLVAWHVSRVANKTPWESKCLVRALTAQKLLKQKGISSTLYLGVGKDNSKMIAHAWLRTGKLYVTGGNGTGYATVAKYRA